MKLNPKNFGYNIKSIKFLGSGVKTRVGQLSVRFPETTNFVGLSPSPAVGPSLKNTDSSPTRALCWTRVLRPKIYKLTYVND